MRRPFVVPLLAACSALGQSIVPPARVPKEWQMFERRPNEQRLDCSVTPLRPRINYSFRFQTGFVAHVPGKLYAGKGHWIASFFRVTPEHSEREPVFFATTTRLPDVPANKVTLEINGGYVIGEGKYKVEWLLTGDSGRVCTKNWTVEAKLGRKERGVPPGMAPGTVDEISLRKWTRGSSGANDEEGRRITILMNVSPQLSRRMRVATYDRGLLLSSLAAAIERLPLRSVKLIVFSLDQQREIYADDDFQPSDFGAVATALSRVELGVVDYEVLRNSRGHVDLLTGLIAESVNDKGSDAVLFLGPKPWQFDKVYRDELPPPAEAKHAPFFYIQFRPFAAIASFPDTIMNAVKRMEGKTFEVYSPGDFAAAIKNIYAVLESKKAAGITTTRSAGRQ